MMYSYTMRIFAIVLVVCKGCTATECQRENLFREDGPLVSTTTGMVRGKYIEYSNTKISAFFGIPFAKPPVGEKRFAKAEPAEPWNGIFLAVEQSSRCMQHPLPNRDNLPPGNYSEDCLYLNIFAPIKECTNNFKGKPVLVYIYGGGFVQGASDTEFYDGSRLVALRDVVIVSINYRVGPLGFLHIGNEDAPGNVGLTDQVLALKWINRNIEFFGGNKESITLFGNSAGSWSINLHLISPLSNNLFNRVIMESGSEYSTSLIESASEARFAANALALAVGCANSSVNLDSEPSTVIKCLRNKDPLMLSEMDQKTRSSAFLHPSVGNEFLPEQPIEAFNSGKLKPIEVMLGVVRDEGTTLLTVWDSNSFSPRETPQLTFEDAKKVIARFFPKLPSHLHELIFNFYFKNITAEDKTAIIKALSYVAGDSVMNCPTMYMGEKLSKAYMYWLSYESSTDDTVHSWMGVHHASDVSYLFGKSSPNGKSPMSSRDERFSDDMQMMWTTFARNGYPLSDESKRQWPLFSSSGNTTYDLNEGNYRSIPFPRKEHCEFWRSILT